MTELKDLIPASLNAVRAGMAVVRAAQLAPVSSVKVKSDKTLLTKTDKKSGGAMREHFEQFRDVSWRIEDTGEVERRGRYRILADPLDGTAPFVLGLPTSTVICGIEDMEIQRVVSVVIGEPARGLIWSTIDGISSTVTDPQGSVRPVSVWPGTDIKKGGTIFLDVHHGFERIEGGVLRQILLDEQAAHLLGMLAQRARRVLLPGSNGIMQALVANGGEGMAGSITTAIGGPWDVCGVLLVLQAGGAARAFSLREGTLAEQDPLKINTYDVLICGNSPATVDALVPCLQEAMH